uniref:Ig-like domain-containing protein n=1 Tax=Anolis carolinensis TaxID=28377 RepID=H9G9Y9_ANOCA
MGPFIVIFLLFFMLKPGSPSEIRLIQSDRETLKPGESLKLTCAASGEAIRKGAGWNWVREPPGKRLEWLGWGFFNGPTWITHYGSAFRGRLSVTLDASRNEYYLQQSSMTTADSGIYYCARGTAAQ